MTTGSCYLSRMDKERFLKDIGKRLKELRGDRT